ncbi:MAG: GAK system CofD-like protein [Desulfonauticus sp.]|nr:GAK system CofD-like protein [Desulfonauticus sp.]
MSSKISFTILKRVVIPDLHKLARFQRSPEIGPKILFFSGGTALRKVSNKLIDYSHNTIHLITPFDSGGSSAVLRKAFNMPAVGDLRNRLMALADKNLYFNPAVFRLFSYRFSKTAIQGDLKLELESMCLGKHELVSAVPDPIRKIIKHHLRFFYKNMPSDFDLRGANVGNLILTAGYLEYERHLDPILFIYSKLVEAKGVVRAIINKNLHLIAILENGEIVCGQHKLTGKEFPPISSKVKKVYLSKSLDNPEPVVVVVRDKIKKLIAEAELICYPIGSFYSSLIANLLPSGVAESIASNPCPKIFVPNTAKDPECFGLDLYNMVETLLFYLRKDSPDVSVDKLLNFVLLDEDLALYPGAEDSIAKLKNIGIEVIKCKLVSPNSYPYIEAEWLVKSLLSIV